MDCKNVVAVNDTNSFSSLLEEAVLLVRQVLQVECPLIHETQIRTHTGVDLYIVPYFEGATYDVVKEMGAPVIGPAALIFLLKEEILLPRRLQKGQDIFSLSLHGSRVCCSNIDEESRDKLYKLVVAMGGTVSPALTSEVTHLVVEEVGSKKYQYAARLGIPIMAPDWITAIWDLCKNKVVKNDKALEEQYRCPCFKGCTICVTGLDIAQRTEVEVLTAKNGGVYSGDLVMEKCTHLLVDTPEGQKYTFATKWKIPCVKSKWFYESIDKGLCLDPKDYTHPPSDKENVPDASYLARPLLEETRDCGMSRDSTMIAGNKHLSAMDVTINKDKGYLDGCRIYLNGFSPSQQEPLRKLINNGGGMRLDVVSSRVSHIVTNNATVKELEQLSEKQPEAAVVSVQWLTDSMEKGTQQPEEQYSMLPTPGVTTDNPLPTLRPAPSRKQDHDQTEILDQYTVAKETNVAMDTHDITTDICTAVNKTKAVDITLQKSSIFEGYEFYVASNITTKIARNVQQQIIANGGICGSDKADFCVVDPFSEVPAYCNEKTIVTYMWLQRCIQSSELLPLSSCVLFSPQPVPMACKALRDCVISYTQLSGYHLAHLIKLIETLGGTPQGTFSHKAVKNSKRVPDCLACTHLVHKTRGSSKHAAAVKWNLPSVTVEWLYACLKTLSKVDTGPFEDRPSVEERRGECLRKAAELVDEANIKDAAAITLTSSGTVLKKDFEGFVTPIKIKRRNIIVDNVMSALESPASFHDDRQNLSSLGSLYKTNVGNAAKKTAPRKILAGVILVIKQGKQIEIPVLEVKSTARRSGAVVKTYVDNSCTHIVCGRKDQKEPNIDKDAKQGVKLVSCYWIMACHEQETRLPELNYPPGFDPKRSIINISVSEDVTVPAVEIDNIQTDKHTDNDNTQQVADCAHSIDANLQKDISLLERIVSRASTDDCDGFVQPGTPRQRQKRSTVRTIRHMDIPVDLSQKPLSVTYEDGKADREAFLARTENEAKLSSPNKHSCNPVIIPRNHGNQISGNHGNQVPDDTFNNSNVPNTSLLPTSSSTPNRTVVEVHPALEGIDIADLDITDLELDNTTAAPAAAAEAVPAPRVFLMTGMNNTEKTEFGNMVDELGGTLLQSSGFDSTCTHLIVAKPNRNEKYLAGVGAGIWVLHPTYLTASHSKGAWCTEGQFMWSNFSEGLRGIQRSLSLASSLWIGKKAFADWNVIFCVSSNKVNNFKGIITAGGGNVLQAQPPYSVQSGLTHAFFEIPPSRPNQISNDIPLRALVEASVLCLKLEYIPEHLTSGGSGESMDSFIIDPARSLMTSSSKRSRDTSLHGTPSKRTKT